MQKNKQFKKFLSNYSVLTMDYDSDFSDEQAEYTEEILKEAILATKENVKLST